MANGKDNLVSLADRTTEEQREIARAGGIASGEARRRKRTLRQIAEMLSDKQIPMKDGAGNIEMVTYDVAMIHSQYQKAIQNKDTKAATYISKLLGEIVDKHEVEAKGAVIFLPKDEIEGIQELAKR